MKNILLGISSLLLLAACGNSQPKVASEKVLDNGNIALTLAQGMNTFENSLTGVSDSKTYIFEAKEGQQLIAKITTATEPSNIRFNQIISPSGNANGPFGQALIYTLNETGEWKLIVAESLMVGEDYTGDFSLSIEVSDTKSN